MCGARGVVSALCSPRVRRIWAFAAQGAITLLRRCEAEMLVRIGRIAVGGLVVVRIGSRPDLGAALVSAHADRRGVPKLYTAPALNRFKDFWRE
jgi:hypothetical protein